MISGWGEYRADNAVSNLELIKFITVSTGAPKRDPRNGNKSFVMSRKEV